MIRPGRLILKLKPGTETRLPSHLDVLDGAARAGGSVDGRGDIDHAILARTTGLRAKRCFHASESLGKIGSRNANWSVIEQSLGLPLILAVRIAEPSQMAAVIASLRDLDQVDWVMAEPLASIPFQITTRPHPTATMTAADLVGAPEARRIEPGSRGVAVAVIDTGVMLEHPEFHLRLRSGYDTVDLGMGHVAGDVSLVGDSLGRDFCARDETGHGSHVAGIIGARGLSMQPGIAGLSPLIPIRALAAARSGEGPIFGVGGLSDIDAAIKVAVDMGAKVLNMSFGTSRAETDPDAPPPHLDSIQYATQQGCIPVAAMGNSGIAEDYFPAALPGCIAVGAMTMDQHRSEFSTTGRHIALCAPGEDIVSAGLAGGYASSSGTSHAAPFVSGAVALLAARAARRGHDLTADQARLALCHSARGGQPNSETGWGMLDIPAALRLLDATDFTRAEGLQ